MIFSDFSKALGQLSDGRFLSVLGLGVGLTLALFLGIFWFVITLIGVFVPDTLNLPFIGEITWVETAISWASVPLMLIMSVFLMVPVASAFTGIFLERIAEAVEDAHYPHLGQARRIGFAEGLGDTVQFLGVLIVANLLALVLYLLSGPLAPLIFWGLNGFLLGREYAQLVAVRWEGAAGARAFRKRHRAEIFAAGVLMAVPLTIPVVNLLVPVLGAATFTHLYHRVSARSRPFQSA
ncbi:MAG: EI24 domain-containing protein [Pseudomonadota bacterium]